MTFIDLPVSSQAELRHAYDQLALFFNLGYSGNYTPRPPVGRG